MPEKKVSLDHNSSKKFFQLFGWFYERLLSILFRRKKIFIYTLLLFRSFYEERSKEENFVQKNIIIQLYWAQRKKVSNSRL